MSQSVKLSDKLVQDAKTHAAVYSRSVPKQIEYWSTIGKIAEENPDMPYELIKEILLSKVESEQGDTTEYQFD